jgi:hypothetical protein
MRVIAGAAVGWLALMASLAGAAEPHVLHVVDDATGRGVPLVELKTVNKIRYYTDSNGVVAFDEPGLLGQRVFFHVASHGYEYPKDGFGYRGVAVETRPGQTTVIKVKRVNVAERLYRITGAGIYDQTVRAGKLAPAPPPTTAPVFNGGVLGQDTVETIEWKGKLFWFWGDTDRAAYPLGQFSTSGATSQLPGKGGLDPSVGVNLKYWVDKDGFSKKMVQGVKKEGPTWISGLMVLKDPTGVERMVADYVTVKSLAEALERGLVVWDEKHEQFGPLTTYPIDERLHPNAQPLRVSFEYEGAAAEDLLYFPMPHPVIRVKAEWKAVLDPHQYEAFTPAKPGARWKKGETIPLDRDAAGKLVWAWKKDTWPVEEKEQEELIKAGQMKADEAWYRMKDDQGQRVHMHAGTVSWNAYRKRWVMVAHQMAGKPSFLGEVWYSEAANPWGPFERAVKVVTHDKYTFYNVVHHPQFDQQGGKLIYLEGTYTNSFSGNDEMTPRYDYNQIMYRLDLSDGRLKFAQQ